MRNIEKIKFSDIIGMLEIDEMKEITGGYGETYACGSYSPSGGGSSYNPDSILAGFGGGTAIGSTIGGIPYNSNTSSSNNGIATGGSSNYGSSSYTAGWTYSNGRMTTNDPSIINRWYDVFMHIYGTTDTKSDPYAISRQINTFVNNESTIAGQQENIRLYGTVLNGLPPLMNNYKGPSTIAPGLMYNNGVLQYDNSFYNNGNTNVNGSGQTGMSASSSVFGKSDNYIFDAKGNLVTVQKMNGDHSIKISMGDKLLDFSDLDTSPIQGANNMAIATKIATYFATQAGISVGFVGTGKSDSLSSSVLAFTKPDGTVVLNTNGGINKLLNNFDNLMSVLKHEQFHQIDFATNKKTDFETHVNVYLKQFNDPTFNNTTSEFKLGQIASVSNYLMNMDQNDPKHEYSRNAIISQINKFNEMKIGYQIINNISYGLNPSQLQLSIQDNSGKIYEVNYGQLKN